MPDERNITDSGAGDSFSNALNNILSNPEMMSMIGSMAEKLKSNSAPAPQKNEAPASLENTESGVSEQPSPPLPDIISTLAPFMSGEKSTHSKRDHDRDCLLRALKPYLSHDRGQAIDYIIKFSSIAEVLKNLS